MFRAFVYMKQEVGFITRLQMFRAYHSASRTLLSARASPVSWNREISNLGDLRAELISRPLNYIHDYLYPTPSHLLNVSLADFLPAKSYPTSYNNDTQNLPKIDEGSAQSPLLPQGHHIVYFPSQIPHRFLLPDGTDPDQSPRGPFNRRMWAGGSVKFANDKGSLLPLHGDRAICVEGIRAVTTTGRARQEKIIVTVERRIDIVSSSLTDEELKVKYWPAEDTEDLGASSIVERRDLIFMRDKTPEEAKVDADKVQRKIRSPHKAEFEMKMTPPPSLLFRFSALTFNAHRIHLDQAYCRDVEGHKNLLVHGPLSLVLMLSLLRGQLRGTERIKSITYRNLAPLYAEEELRVCGMEIQERKETDKGLNEATRNFQIWIENEEGGLAVRGRAEVEEITRFDHTS